MSSTDFEQYLASCCEIAHEAGDIIMRHFAPNIASQQKPDRTPVTVADTEANSHIVAALQKLTPHIPIVAEEDEVMNLGGHSLFWLVDPLDGTRAFIRGEEEFTVNIGLVRGGKPLLGVVYAPAAGIMYSGHVALGAWRIMPDDTVDNLRVRVSPEEGMVVVRSQSHPSPKTIEFLDSIKTSDIISLSSSIKFCMVAEGSADIYPRFGRTMEWDTAAGHAILQAAGGSVQTLDGSELTYGKRNFENPGFIAYGG